MTTQDTKVDNLIINKLTKQQYAQITPNENEIYLVEDDFNPDALSDLAYSGSFSDLLNKPTTLSGYGITNAYTKTEVDNKLTSTYKAAGSASSVSNLGTLDASHEGFVYNMTTDFTTTSDFVEGAGKQHYAGANVAIVNTGTSGSPVYKYDILGDFIDLSGYQLSNTAVTHTASTSVGDSTTPVYINSNGVATALSYTIAKSVPADALFTDTVYTHPTTSGNKHIPSGGSSGKILKWSADGTATWETEYSYTHPTDAGNKHIPSGGSSGQVLAYGGSSGTATWTTLTDNDTKNTAGTTNNTGKKLYLAGALTQDTNPQTYSNSNVFIDTSNRLNSAAPASDANDTTVATTKWVKDQGYTTNTGTVTSVNSVSPVNGNVTLTIPDAQIQSDWNQTNTSAKDYIKNKPTIPAGVVVDQTYSSSSANAQSGVAISGAGFLQNATSNTGSLNILGNNISDSTYSTIVGDNSAGFGINSVAIGYSAGANTNSVAIGYGALAKSLIDGDNDNSVAIGTNANVYAHSVAIGGSTSALAYSIAIGYGATAASHDNIIQLGYGTNTTSNTFNVGFYNNSTTHYNWQLLDGTTGLIPDARLSSNIARTVDIPSAVTETTVSGWGFTKNTGTVTSVNNVSPTNGNVTLSIPTITDTYSGTSSDGMSGKAVKSAIDTAISSVYKASGSIAFADRPTPGSSYKGNVYNITDSFTTTSDFVEGAGNTYPAGTNIVCINTSGSTYKYDVLAGFVDLSVYQQTSTAVTHTESTSAGSSTQPVYVNSSGVATACTYTLGKSVPVDAVFTDTKHTAGSSNSTSKLFLIGANTQGTSSTSEQARTTYSNSAVYEQNGYLYATTPASTTNDTTVATTKFVKDQGYTSNTGTITGITMNGASKGTSGVVDLGTVLTSHQDISGKQDTLVSGTNIKTINNESILGSGDIVTLQNAATGTNSLSILGSAIWSNYSVNIGKSTNINADYGVAIGYDSGIGLNATNAIAIGYDATVSGSAVNSIQIGRGTNSTANTFAVGFNGTSYTLFNATTGKIPDAIISDNVKIALKIIDYSE